jgi:hypothetical protein
VSIDGVLALAVLALRAIRSIVDDDRLKSAAAVVDAIQAVYRAVDDAALAAKFPPDKETP